MATLVVTKYYTSRSSSEQLKTYRHSYHTHLHLLYSTVKSLGLWHDHGVRKVVLCVDELTVVNHEGHYTQAATHSSLLSSTLFGECLWLSSLHSFSRSVGSITNPLRDYILLINN